MQTLRKFFTVALLVIVTSLGISAALAQPTQLPLFDRSRHVYVGPTWKGDIDGTVQAAVNEASKYQNLETYVVYTDRGSEAQTGNMPFAATKMTQLFQTWSRASDFPHGNFLLILVLRDASAPTGYAVSTRIADGPGRFVGKEQRTQITKNNMTILQSAPGKFPVVLVNQISDAIKVNAVAAQGRSTPKPDVTVTNNNNTRVVQKGNVQESGDTDFTVVLLILLGIGGAVLVVVRLRQYSKLSEQLAKVESEDNPVLENAAEGTTRLEKSYMGMLTHKYDFSAGSDDAAEYEHAMKAWGKFTFGQAALAEIIEKANLLKKKAIPVLRHGPLKEAIFNRTEAMMTIEGDAVANQDLDLLQGFVEKETLSVADAIQALNQNFKTANTLVGGIYARISAAAKNSGEIDAAVKEIGDLRAELVDAQIDSTELDKEIASIKGKTEKMKLALQTTPKTALGESESIKSEVLSLKTALEDALELHKGGLEVIDASINEVEKSVVAERRTIALLEEGGNPDKHIDEAKAQSAALKKKLASGLLHEAETAKAGAHDAIASALAVIDFVHLCKKNVEDGVAGARAAAVAADEATLKAIGSAFDAQQFVKASTALDALKALQADRSKAHAQTELCTKLRASVQAKMTANAQSVSAATDKVFAGAVKAVSALEESTQATAPDWKALLEKANQTANDLTALEKSIDEQVQARKDADNIVTTLAHDIASAGDIIGDDRVAQGPKTQLAEVKATLSELQSSLKGNKKDWAAISDKAKAALERLEDATRTAQSDIDSAERLEAELQANATRIDGYVNTNYSRTIRGKSYGGATFNSATAMAHQRAAEQYYRDRDYARMEAELAAARREADSNNMLCWWIMMESMHSSNDRYARDWAYHQGYRDGNFDSWSESRIGNSSSIGSASSGTSGDATFTGGDTWAPAADIDSWKPNTSDRDSGNSGGWGGDSTPAAPSCSTPSAPSCSTPSSPSCSSSSCSSSSCGSAGCSS